MNNVTQNTESIKLDGLKAYREENNISVEAAADGMKVSKDFIHFIEAGQFEKLGAPTFLRGHLTNYSKVLGINPQTILTQIPNQFLQYQEIKTSDALGASPLARVKHQSNHLGRYAIGTALLSMLCLSFYFVWDKWSDPQKRTLVDNIALSQDDNNGNKKITYSSLIPQVSESINPPVLEEEQVSTETEDVNDIDATDSDTDESLGIKNGESELVDDAVEEDNGTLNVMNSGYSVKMQLAEKSWVSIKTLDGDKIVHDLIGPGLREYHSEQPIHFRMGNVDNMELFINDDQVELSQFVEEDIADFNWPIDPSS